MSTPVERIHNLMTSLPEKDVKLGYEFLEKRNFDLLKSLVDSALFKVQKNRYKSNPDEGLQSVNIDDLRRLKSEVFAYVTQLELYDDDNNDNFNNWII